MHTLKLSYQNSENVATEHTGTGSKQGCYILQIT